MGGSPLNRTCCPDQSAPGDLLGGALSAPWGRCTLGTLRPGDTVPRDLDLETHTGLGQPAATSCPGLSLRTLPWAASEARDALCGVQHHRHSRRPASSSSGLAACGLDEAQGDRGVWRGLAGGPWAWPQGSLWNWPITALPAPPPVPSK